jgi:glyoxylase-like metal-dependent hydrolase (beta-lactamase superfamily II)
MTQVPAQPNHKPEIRVFPLGPFETNCYVVSGPDPKPGDPCWVADCGLEPRRLISAIESLGMEPEAVVLTHAHLDHIAGLFEFRRRFPRTPIWIHRAEEQWLTDPVLNLSGGYGIEITGPTPDRLLEHGQTLTLLGEMWEVRHTPGHSPGGITLYHAASGTAIVGDTLFAGSIGRTDFPGSDHATLARSIREQIYTLPEETLVLPGHGPTTTVGREKMSNPYVRGDGVTV